MLKQKAAAAANATTSSANGVSAAKQLEKTKGKGI